MKKLLVLFSLCLLPYNAFASGLDRTLELDNQGGCSGLATSLAEKSKVLDNYAEASGGANKDISALSWRVIALTGVFKAANCSKSSLKEGLKTAEFGQKKS